MRLWSNNAGRSGPGFNPRTPCGVRLINRALATGHPSVSIHALLAECDERHFDVFIDGVVSIHALLAECDGNSVNIQRAHGVSIHALLAECDSKIIAAPDMDNAFQSTHSLRSATAPNLIHCYSTKQIILCANLPKKTVIARLLFLSIYLSIFYSQCITPIADLPGNSCELEVGAQAMFNSL